MSQQSAVLALVVACLCLSQNQAQPFGLIARRPALGGGLLQVCNSGVVPREVANLKADDLGNSQIELSWAAPSGVRACGVAYNVTARPKGSGFQPRVATTTETKITPYGLLSGVRYIFTVQVGQALDCWLGSLLLSQGSCSLVTGDGCRRRCRRSRRRARGPSPRWRLLPARPPPARSRTAPPPPSPGPRWSPPLRGQRLRRRPPLGRARPGSRSGSPAAPGFALHKQATQRAARLPPASASRSRASSW